jgi:superfamily II DNA or RNA helicase
MSAFHQDNPRAQFLIIVPTTALLDQWYVSLTEDLNIPPWDIACFSGEEKPERTEVVNVMVINTARSLVERIEHKKDWFLIVDECHRSGSPSNRAALRGDYGASLGLSATPEREHDSGYDEYIVPALGPMFFSYDYAAAYADNVICKFDLINVRIPLLPDETEAYAKLSKRAAVELRRIDAGEGDSGSLETLLRKRARVVSRATYRIPTTARIIETHRGSRSLIFHESVDDVVQIQHVLEARNHSVTAYHTQIGPSVRRHNLTLFRRGLFDVLVCCRALDEGMNVPETTVAIIASSTASTRQRIQRLGRVLRPARGKERALIYTVYASEQEKRRLQAEHLRLRDIANISWQEVCS